MQELLPLETKAAVAQVPVARRRFVRSQLAIGLSRTDLLVLKELQAALKGTNVSRPALYRAKQKINDAIRLRDHSKNPHAWPKVWRQVTAAGGTEKKKGSAGQWTLNNARALPTPLGKLHRWSGNNTLPLFIIGPVHKIVEALADADHFGLENATGGSNAGAQDFQLDSQERARVPESAAERAIDDAAVQSAHGALPFWFTIHKKNLITMKHGEVMLNARGEVFELALSSVAGGAGGFSAASPQIIDSLKTSLDVVDFTAAKLEGLLAVIRKKVAKVRNNVWSVEIGIDTRLDDKFSISSGSSQLNQTEASACILAAIAKAS